MKKMITSDNVKVRLNGQRGMSLVEATIILMVLAILTAVIAPSAGDFVNDARQTKAKEDVEAIGMSILRLMRDTGLTCLSDTPSPATAACSKANRIDLLVSSGDEPTVIASAYAGSTSQAATANLNWAGENAPTGEISTQRGTIDAHLVLNTPTYATASLFTSGGGPKQGIGWRGAYLTGPVGADPWGFMYQANTVFLTVASDATAGTGEGLRSGGWHQDVVVASAGSNGSMQVSFGSAGQTANSTDDVIYTLKGSTR